MPNPKANPNGTAQAAKSLKPNWGDHFRAISDDITSILTPKSKSRHTTTKASLIETMTLLLK
jgi:hypothetical protein